ncbi:dihydroxyacetone kinase family protein [Parablautia sp. Marseille-Q6255]|uniref:dihydroxyacetone kinase family protein n=1 Tax=Parablautia sp. Marseille-Q6255 TaxID=3039593 RepID=UPI0024BC4C3E|nr:dihydroxyacetone kinase subunit L [Parablautia sp. Marseille-Q6255]
MEKVTVKELPELFGTIAVKFEENAELLCEMDSKMGDGDLGLTMKKGFGGLPEIIRTMEEENFSRKLRKAGMEMTDLVPSTMGMLMGTGISFGGKALGEKSELDGEGLVLFLEGFCSGIVKRGKCAEGDRTVLDCFAPAAKKARALLEEEKGASLKMICEAALEGAKEGVEATKNMVPKFGKAAVHANIAYGVADQGAVAGLIMIEGMADYIL